MAVFEDGRGKIGSASSKSGVFVDGNRIIEANGGKIIIFGQITNKEL